MDSATVGSFWDADAPAWIHMARAGYDLCRDLLNTPAFLKMLPPVAGKRGLDIGCGEGNNTRKLAALGAVMSAVDISPNFVKAAQSFPEVGSSPIEYQVGDGQRLPFTDQQFDFATAFMSLMDMPDVSAALREAYRILKSGGFLQFSITHPCSDVVRHRNVRDASGAVVALELGGYFRGPSERMAEWTFGAAPRELSQRLGGFKVPTFRRTLSDWLNELVAVGYLLEAVHDPCPGDVEVEKEPYLQDCQVMPQFMIVQVRKPSK